MSSESNLWYLENIDLFDVLCPTKMAAAEPKIEQYKKGDFIYFPNEPSEQIYLIHEGRVKVGSYSEGGREVIKSILSKGDIFGELALAGEEKRGDFAQAMEASEICIVSLDDVTCLMQDSVGFSLKITRMIGDKLIRTERRLESLVFKDARTRIVEFIRDLVLEKGEKVGDELLIRNFLTHKEIAHLTGTSRQTVTTVLNELREKNLIYFDRKRLLVRNVETLA